MKMTASAIFIQQKISLLMAILQENVCLDGGRRLCHSRADDLAFRRMQGDDFCDNSMEAIERIAEYEASVGVTAIAPATMTLTCRGAGRCFKNCRTVQA